MFLFQAPPPTRYDLGFSIAGIPVRVHPLFWLITILFGSSGGLMGILLWVPVVFVSILVHELGHALAFRWYGQRSYILLHFAGGLTVPESVSWGSGWASVATTPMQQVLISFAGPGAGFLLAAVVTLGVQLLGDSTLTRMLLFVNIFWGLINLAPVFPLDGGNIARTLFVQFDPLDGFRKSLWLSVVAGGIMALAGLYFFHSVFMALLFGLLAFQSYQFLQNRIGY